MSLLPTANTNWYQIDSREIIPSEQINQPNCMFFFHFIFGNEVDHLVSSAFGCVSYILSEGKLSYVSCIISEETLVFI